MAEKSFDLTISFDKAKYLDPQIYMMIDTLKDNVPDDTVLHVTTNRSRKSPLIKYIRESIPTKVYIKPPFNDLRSRCQYMFHCFEVKTDKDYVIKLENDIFVLKHLKEFERVLRDDYDVVIQSENRRVVPDDNIELRLWRHIYRALKVKMPQFKIHFVENHEEGRPLLATGIVAVKSDILDTINRRWVPMTKVCENWIQFNIHPNEFAFTAMIFDEGWDWGGLPTEFNFNPIGHFRKGNFPSTDLIDDCVLPEETVIFDYHRPQWLFHVAKYNPQIMEIINRNKQYVPREWWNISKEIFMERQ